jgi:predicted component of type VI protein secretion system
LEIECGPGKGERRELFEGQLHLGRASTADWRIDCDSASRHHATLFREGNVVVLRDEDSHNGTFVNEVRVDEDTALSAGDRIHIGDTVFCLIVDGQRERRQDPPVAMPPAPDKADERASTMWRNVAVFALAILAGTLLFAFLLPWLGAVAPMPTTGTRAEAADPVVAASSSLPSTAVPSPPPSAPEVSAPRPSMPALSNEPIAVPAMALPTPLSAPPPPPAPAASELSDQRETRMAGRASPRSTPRAKRSRSRDERRAIDLYRQGEIGKAIAAARATGATGLVNQLKSFEKAEGAARAAFTFKKGTEAIQYYEEAFALDEELRALDDLDAASVPGRRVAKALSNLYLQAGEVFLSKKDLDKAETFLERALDYDQTNARARKTLQKVRAEAR